MLEDLRAAGQVLRPTDGEDDPRRGNRLAVDVVAPASTAGVIGIPVLRSGLAHGRAVGIFFPLADSTDLGAGMPADASVDQAVHDAIEATFLLLEDNFDTLYQRCSTSEQKRHLIGTYSATRYACWKMGKQERVDEGKPDSEAARDLKIINARLVAMLPGVDDVDAFLGLAAQATRLAALLVPPSTDA